MTIGLIDVDGHNFPNLALMKLSAWHKAQGDTVEWWWGFVCGWMPYGEAWRNHLLHKFWKG